ncbi:phosphoglycolate phosphatase [Marinobacter daqiaonensis]|uniref:Phosphoglycolate phosphatase n=1 Tax=Marinobacter daqiaonensis TaxID=650891 RepID=A0A1I6JSP1_9GAMM|nr:phosphoglycolate phosphatase [Marinobacter daqiaonensis]SFR81995.1 phosphoglycolate phosphatase [Marinobacter daqiaonensis]
MEARFTFTHQWPGVALFDLDGTLVDSAPDVAAAVNHMLETFDRKPVDAEKVSHWVGNGSEELVRRALTGRVDWRAAEPLDDALVNDALNHYLNSYEELNGAHSTVYEGVEPFLRHLHEQGCRMGVVTNKPERFISPLLEQMGLEHWFDRAVGGDTLAVRKPDAGPLLLAMHALGGNLGNTVMIGDSAADVEAARNAGLPSVIVRYGYNFGAPVDDLGADVVVDSLTELL